MSTIPVSEVVRITPSVLPAGGSALDLSGLVLTLNSRVPIGTVQTFLSELSVEDYFGGGTVEAKMAERYFAGFDNSNKKPGAMLFAQYPQDPVGAYLRGGNLEDVTLSELQGFSGTLSVTIDNVVKSASVNLTGATSFTNAAMLIADALNIAGPQACTFTGAIASTTLTVSAILTGGAAPIQAGQTLTGSGVTATYIVGQLTGTPGGIGTYQVADSQSAASTTITGFTPAVQYDSVSSSFKIISPTTGVNSTIGFGSGALANDLKLTETLGAVLSPGAAAATPDAFMSALIQVTQRFASWTLAWNPDASGNDIRYAFCQWNASKNNRYALVISDSDAAPTTTVPATSCLAQRIRAAGLSGICPVWSAKTGIDYANVAAFVMSIGASYDFTQLNGRATFKFRRQSGLEADVSDQQVFDNLAANGYNSYGAYASATTDFIWFANGVVSGDFLWMDSFMGQIWLNAGFTNDLVALLQSAFSIPYNSAGRALIEAALADRIQQGLNFGIYRAGVTLSQSQRAAVNAAVGKNIADTIQNQGWYLQVGDTPPEVRQQRGSPPMTFYYADGQSVQEIDMASIALL